MKKLIALMALALTLTACGSDTNTKEVKEEEVKEEVKQEEAAKDETEGEVKEETEESEKPKEDDVPREYKNALRSAENYISMMPFSEKGLYDQLTSEAADKYPAEAAQYAIDNIKVDYNEQALKAAQNYLNMMPMSDEQLKQQLMSDAGDKYTEEQAQYAIDHLD